MPLKQDVTPEKALEMARDIGPKTFELIHRMFDEAKVRMQPMQTVMSILALLVQERENRLVARLIKLVNEIESKH